MASILQGQIDFLCEQVDALPPADRDIVEIEDAMAVALSLFTRTISGAAQQGTRPDRTLLNHWLNSAEAILIPLREVKSRGHRPKLLEEFMRAVLKARAVVADDGDLPQSSGSRPLEEVERELDSRAD
jgi:hypothetical protein